MDRAVWLRGVVAFGVSTWASTASAQSNPCAQYGFSGQPANTLKCVSLSPDKREVFCAPGFHVHGTNAGSIVLTGAARFPGCRHTDLCVTYGYSGNFKNVSSCTNTGTQRVIRCLAGYVVQGTSSPSIALDGAAPFVGCVASACQRYGGNTQAANTLGCTDVGEDKRRLECAKGFVIAGTADTGITLAGDAAFPGCIQNTCYAFNTRDANIATCVPGVGQRTITCKDGYVVKGSTSAATTLPTTTTFPGCRVSDFCKVYGFSGKADDTTGCVNTSTGRTISCAPGAFITGTTARSVTLVGAGAFAGCTRPGNRDQDCDHTSDCGLRKDQGLRKPPVR